MEGSESSTTAEIYMQAHERTAISTALHSPKVWNRFVDDVYSILKRTSLENFFHHINNLHQNIKFTMEKEINGVLAFLHTLLKRNNGKISVLVYRKPTHTDQYLITSLTVTKASQRHTRGRDQNGYKFTVR